MRVTVCELPHEPAALGAAWDSLCEHTAAHASELVLLPELTAVPPVWTRERFDDERWRAAEAASEACLRLLPRLGADRVVGTRAIRSGGRRLIQGYIWSEPDGVRPLRSKYYLPREPGAWEAAWFDRGDPEFPLFRAGAASFGLSVCTELWALETHGDYAALGADLLLSPRATEAATMSTWLALGVVAAVRSGAFGVSSNRVDPTGACGGGGWIIDPAGKVLAVTSAAEPFVTRDLDLAVAAKAKESYPRSVFAPAVPAAP
jgi:N-carbamoylputrescine amidase